MSADLERSGRRGLDPGERNFLRVSAVRIARLQPEAFELFGDVFDRKLFAFRAGRAAFEFIRGEHLDVLEQIVGC